MDVHFVFGSIRRAWSLDCPSPLLGLGPRLLSGCGPAKSKRWASVRKRAMNFNVQTLASRYQLDSGKSAIAPTGKLTATISRSGYQERSLAKINPDHEVAPRWASSTLGRSSPKAREPPEMVEPTVAGSREPEPECIRTTSEALPQTDEM